MLRAPLPAIPIVPVICFPGFDRLRSTTRSRTETRHDHNMFVRKLFGFRMRKSMPHVDTIQSRHQSYNVHISIERREMLFLHTDLCACYHIQRSHSHRITTASECSQWQPLSFERLHRTRKTASSALKPPGLREWHLENSNHWRRPWPRTSAGITEASYAIAKHYTLVTGSFLYGSHFFAVT